MTFVSETFDLCLPAPPTMICQGKRGSRLQPACRAVPFKDKTRNGQQVLVSLMLDEMAMHPQNAEWDAKCQKLVGFVDLGRGIDDDSASVVTEI